MTYRKVLLAVFIMGIICTIGSFFSQYVLMLNPCPLCILQRLAVMAVMVVSGLCLLLPVHRQGGQVLAAVAVSVPALWGLYTALYQIWLQSLPLMEQPSCGAPWSFRLRDWPLFEVWEPVIRGMGNCGVREFVLGVPLPVWSALFFSATLLVIWGMWLKLRGRA